MIEETIKKLFSDGEEEQPSPWKRQPIIAGNWKMNKTNTEAEALLKELLPLVENVKDRAVVICPPDTALTLAVRKARHPPISAYAPRTCIGRKAAPTRASCPPPC